MRVCGEMSCSQAWEYILSQGVCLGVEMCVYECVCICGCESVFSKRKESPYIQCATFAGMRCRNKSDRWHFLYGQGPVPMWTQEQGSNHPPPGLKVPLLFKAGVRSIEQGENCLFTKKMACVWCSGWPFYQALRAVS